jgi:hypothetical protein
MSRCCQGTVLSISSDIDALGGECRTPHSSTHEQLVRAKYPSFAPNQGRVNRRWSGDRTECSPIYPLDSSHCLTYPLKSAASFASG